VRVRRGAWPVRLRHNPKAVPHARHALQNPASAPQCSCAVKSPFGAALPRQASAFIRGVSKQDTRPHFGDSFDTFPYVVLLMARAVLHIAIRKKEEAVRKTQRVLLHLACIARKSVRGRACGWHWQHLLREFGCGEYCDRRERQKRYTPLEAPTCST